MGANLTNLTVITTTVIGTVTDTAVDMVMDMVITADSMISMMLAEDPIITSHRTRMVLLTLKPMLTSTPMPTCTPTLMLMLTPMLMAMLVIGQSTSAQ